MTGARERRGAWVTSVARAGIMKLSPPQPSARGGGGSERSGWHTVLRRSARAGGGAGRTTPLVIRREPVLDGLITNGKFCCVRRARLSLSWWHRPLLLRDLL